jgi:hypothetical protein
VYKGSDRCVQENRPKDDVRDDAKDDVRDDA